MGVVIFLLMPAILFLQAHYVDKRYGKLRLNPECPWCDENSGGTDDVVFIPLDASIMRLISPADPLFLADLLWLRTSYYFGSHMVTNRVYPYLFHLLDLITDLSPEWLFPYIFGAVILPIEAEAVENGLYLIEKGLINHPSSWELWFYNGYYMWKFRNDFLAASRAFHKASLLSDSPAYLTRLAATFATRAGKKELAKRFLEQALETIQDPHQRELISKKLIEVTKIDPNGS